MTAQFLPTRLWWLLFTLVFVAGVEATDRTVTVGDDSAAAGTLRNTLTDAVAGDTILFAPDLTGTITLAGQPLLIDKDITIVGPGAEALAISGNQVSRVFVVSDGVTFHLSGLTLRDGHAPNGTAGTNGTGNYGPGNPNTSYPDSGTAGGNGGAILSTGHVYLTQCIFTANVGGSGGRGGSGGGSGSVGQDGANGGLGGKGGAIHSSGTLSVDRCVFIQNCGGLGGLGGNSTKLYFGGASSPGLACGGLGGEGGAIFNASSDAVALVVSDSTFDSNLGGVGGEAGYNLSGAGTPLASGSGGNGGAVASASGTVAATGSTFVQNRAGDSGSIGFYHTPTPPFDTGGAGGAVALLGGSLSMTNCTLTLNQAGSNSASTSGRGIGGSGGAIRSSGALTLVSCTLARNAAGVSGGAANLAPYQDGLGGGISIAGGTTTLRNSIVADNTIGSIGSAPDLSGSVVSAGYNLIGRLDGSSGVTPGANGDLGGTVAAPLDPAVGLLQNNGGLTLTIGLLAASPAADAGDDTLTGTDQRGAARLVGSHVDIGAVELRLTTTSLISFSRLSSVVSEVDGTITVQVTRSGADQATETVNFATASGTATSGGDFLARSGTLTFLPGEHQKTIVVSIVNDTAAENDETFTISLSAPSGTASLGLYPTHTVTITSEDLTEFAFAQAGSTVAETAGAASVTVLRVGSSSTSQTVQFTTVAGSATAGSDFVSSSGTLTFGVGETQKTISVIINNDSTVESDEQFTIVLSSPGSGSALGAQSIHTVTIQSEDLPPHGTIAFAQAASTATELDGTHNVVVTRANFTPAGESVLYATASGSAVAGSDFTGVSGTLTFAAGETQKTISIPILNDVLAEGDETFTVTLSAPTGAVLGVPTTHTVTIFSDDAATSGIIQFAAAASSISETAGTVTVNVQRTGLLPASETVHYATSPGTALAGSDFTGTSGTLTFAAGETAKTIVVPILDDALVESDETFSVVLSAPGGGAALGATITHVVTIQSEDVAQNGTVAFAQAASSATELAGTLNVVVARTNFTPAGETVQYATVSGSAVAGSDFTGVSGTLTFAAGETQKTIVVPILDDALGEGDETFSVVLSAPGGGAVLGAPTTHVVTIVSDDPTKGIVAFAQASSTVGENAGSANLIMMRTGNTAIGASFQYAVQPGTATSGADYTASSGTFSFLPGETQKTLAVPIVNDTDVENDETFVVTLSSPDSNTVLGATTTHTVTIQSDDPALPSGPQISFAVESLRVSEGVGSVVVPLTVAPGGNGPGPFSVHYATSDGTAISGLDFQGVEGNLNFGNGGSPRLEIPLLHNRIVEGDETFTITLSAPTGGAVLGEQFTMVVTIADKPSAVAVFQGIATSPTTSKKALVTITRSGLDRFTASAKFGSNTYRFASNLNGYFSGTKQINPGHSISFELFPAGDGRAISGWISFPGDSDDRFQFQLTRAETGTEAHPVPGAGYYTALLNSETPTPLRGYVTANVRTNGVVVLTGALPDGRTVSQTTHLNELSELPLYFVPPGRQDGYAGGTVMLATSGNYPLQGSLRWETAGAPASFSDQSFYTLDLSGAPFVWRTGRLLDDFDASHGAGSIRFTGAGLSTPITAPLTLLASNRVLIPLSAPGRVQLRFVPSTGLFNGSFLHADGRRRAFKGVCVQQAGAILDSAEGLFLHPDGAGVVKISATP